MFLLKTMGVLNGGHKVLADKKFKGYRVPNGTNIRHNAHYIHHNPEVWGDPSPVSSKVLSLPTPFSKKKIN